MITARPIRFTADIPAHQRTLEALGATLLTEAPGWLVYAVGSGRLALHQANDQQPAGMTTLAFEVDDLEAWSREATARGLEHEVGMTDHGVAGIVRAGDGTAYTVDPALAGEAPPTGLSVLPIWYTEEVEAAWAILEGTGARKRIAGDDGGWVDFGCAGGGLVAVHRDAGVRVELALEYDGDVEALTEPLASAGIGAAVIDESYSRTLRLPDPDHPGREIWVNQKQTDLYGYSVVG